MGISNGQKELNYSPDGLNICKSCGAYCRYRVYCTYMSFTLFFIPLFKWSKRYIVECLNCGTIFNLDKEIGKKIEYGENVIISQEHLEASTSYSGTKKESCNMFCCFYRIRMGKSLSSLGTNQNPLRCSPEG